MKEIIRKQIEKTLEQVGETASQLEGSKLGREQARRAPKRWKQDCTLATKAQVDWWRVRDLKMMGRSWGLWERRRMVWRIEGNFFDQLAEEGAGNVSGVSQACCYPWFLYM